MKSFLRILSYGWPYRRYMFLNFMFNLLSVVAGLFSIVLSIPVLSVLFGTASMMPVPASGKIGFNQIYNSFMVWLQELTANNREHALLLIVSLVIVSALLKNGTRYLAAYYRVIWQNLILYNMRKKLYDKCLHLPLSYYTNERKGDLLSRVSTDLKEIEIAQMSALEAVFRDPLNILVYLFSLVFISYELSLIILLLLPVVGIIGYLGRALKKRSEKNQQAFGNVLSRFEETLSGIRAIKAFVAERKMNESFDTVNDEARKINTGVNHRGDIASPLSETLGLAVVGILIWIGGTMVFDQKMDASVFIGYFAVFSQVIPPIKTLSQAFFNVQKGVASLGRYEQVINEPEKITDPKNPISLGRMQTGIRFENVSFKYLEKEVLKKINITVNKGETVALVGPSGAGKSTIADLLSRFYDVTDGSITVDGTDIRNTKPKELRRLMGIVSQESILFNDTVSANIALGSDTTDLEKIKEAAQRANAVEFITHLEGNYDFIVGEKGSKLSGGQRQRICIARALYPNPDILVLDEATSALDAESEQLVQQALDKLMDSSTTLVIAHRLSTIKKADRIYVLDKGMIVEEGTHKQLLDNAGLYARLVQLQELK